MLSIFLEFASGGSLTSIVRKFGPLPPDTVSVYTHQILLGLQYLHNESIVHRDVKVRAEGFHER